MTKCRELLERAMAALEAHSYHHLSNPVQRRERLAEAERLTYAFLEDARVFLASPTQGEKE